MKSKYPIFYLFFSFLLLFFIFFKSEIIFQGSNRDYYKIYYIISLSLILFSTITFFFNKIINEILLISIFTCIFSLYCFETFLNLKGIYFQKPKLENKIRLYSQKTGKIYDERSKFQIYSDLKKESENVSVTMYPRDSLNEKNNFFYLSGFNNSLTINCNENGYFSINQSDRYGFNNEDYLWDLEQIDIILIGDSYAYGECVNRENNFASQIGKLKKLNVLNLGYGGNGPLINLAILKEFKPKKFSKVIWFFTESNDLTDLSKELKNDILRQYLINQNYTQNLKSKLIEKEIYLENKIKDFLIQKENTRKFNYINFLKILSTRNLIINKNFNPPINEFENIIDHTLKIIDKNNFFFVYVPSGTKYFENTKYDYFYNEIIKIIKDKKINLIDLKIEFSNNIKNVKNLYPLQEVGHFSENGYYKVSELISTKISN
jgi:hypothetical protein